MGRYTKIYHDTGCVSIVTLSVFSPAAGGTGSSGEIDESENYLPKILRNYILDCLSATPLPRCTQSLQEHGAFPCCLDYWKHLELSTARETTPCRCPPILAIDADASVLRRIWSAVFRHLGRSRHVWCPTGKRGVHLGQQQVLCGTLGSTSSFRLR